jgi:hypothetical protein
VAIRETRGNGSSAPEPSLRIAHQASRVDSAMGEMRDLTNLGPWMENTPSRVLPTNVPVPEPKTAQLRARPEAMATMAQRQCWTTKPCRQSLTAHTGG